jgi:hypothetical protein
MAGHLRIIARVYSRMGTARLARSVSVIFLFGVCQLFIAMSMHPRRKYHGFLCVIPQSYSPTIRFLSKPLVLG